MVSRYAALVHSAARRICGDDALAADASQLVFILLAQKAKSLTSHPSLAGWLHVTAVMQTRNLLDKTRRETRKRQIFQSAMETHFQSPSDTAWQEIQPVLDDALEALSERDREAILLRFYRSLSVREIAATLGIATDAAQKRLDRATERLREKLTRRGVTTAGSLSAVMLAGFSADAQASVISTSVLSSKAIAASSATSTGIRATLTAMKASTYTAPAVLLSLSGTWIVSQRLKLSEPDRRSTALQSALASHSLSPTYAAAAVPAKSTQPPSKIDVKTLSAEYAKSNESQISGLSFYSKYSGLLEGMSAEELGSLLEDLYALGATDGNALALAHAIMPLMLRDHFLFAFEHFQPQLQELTGNDVAGGFGKWAEQDLAAASLWLDRQIASGKLDSKSLDSPNPLRAIFETELFQKLFLSDPAAAAARLASLPENERSLVFPKKFDSSEILTTPPLVQMSALIRNHFSPTERAAQIASLAFRNGKTDLPKVAEFLDGIAATPAERNATAMDLGLRFYGTSLSRETLDSFREEIRKIAPQQLDGATGHALATAMLGEIGLSFEAASALSLQYHEAGAGDDLLIHLCGSQTAKKNKAAARLVVEKISNPQRREALLNQLK